MGLNEVDRKAYLLMFVLPHHGIFIYIFTLAVFMFLAADTNEFCLTLSMFATSLSYC